MRRSPRLVTALTVVALVASTLSASTLSASTPAGAIDAVPYIVGGTEVTAVDDAAMAGGRPQRRRRQPLHSPDLHGNADLTQPCPHRGPLRNGQERPRGHQLRGSGWHPRSRRRDRGRPSRHGGHRPSDVDRIERVDLAILTLSTPILNIEPLSIRPVAPGIGDGVTAYGWGGTLATDRGSNSYPRVAQKGTMTVTTDYGSTTNCGFGFTTPDAVDHSHQVLLRRPGPGGVLRRLGWTDSHVRRR